MSSATNFKQKSIFEYKEFTLHDDVIKVISKKDGNKWEFEVKYDDLGVELIRKTETKGRNVLLTLGTAVIGIIIFIGFKSVPKDISDIVAFTSLLGVGAYIAFLGVKKGKVKYIYLTGGAKELELYDSKPNQAATDDFIQTIHAKIREARRKRYMNLKNDAHIAMDVKVQWIEHLTEIEAITKEERQTLIHELTAGRSSPIGFGFRNS